MESKTFNVTYKKNYGRSQMLITPLATDDFDDYETELQSNFRYHMIKENCINGLLRTQIQFSDRIPSFCYDISGTQNLKVILDSTLLTYHILCKIFLGLYNSLLSIEKYMLSYEHILPDIEYIFISPEYSHVHFCYYPLCNHDFCTSIRKLFDELLKHVDHNDEKAIYLAYTMHNECLNADFDITKLLCCLSSIPSENMYSVQLDKCDSTENELKEDMLYTTAREFEQPAPSLLTSVKSAFQKDTTNFFIKIVILIISTMLAFVLSIALLAFNVIDIKFFMLLIAIILIVAVYNGYMIHSLYAPSKLSSMIATDQTESIDFNTSTLYSKSPSEYDQSSTVLLCDIPKDCIYKLIYTGTDSRHDIELKTFPFIIGKSPTCDSYITAPTISRIHAKIQESTNSIGQKILVIEDLNSTNGTLLNGTPLSPYEQTPLALGDTISFAGITYMLR